MSWLPFSEEIRAYITCGPLLLTTLLRGKSLAVDSLVAELAWEARSEMSCEDWLSLLKAGKAYQLHFSGGFRQAHLLRVREEGARLELTFQFAVEGTQHRETKKSVLEVQQLESRFCKRFDE